jgi:hypothetical protein
MKTRCITSGKLLAYPKGFARIIFCDEAVALNY